MLAINNRGKSSEINQLFKREISRYYIRLHRSQFQDTIPFTVTNEILFRVVKIKLT